MPLFCREGEGVALRVPNQDALRERQVFCREPDKPRRNEGCLGLAEFFRPPSGVVSDEPRLPVHEIVRAGIRGVGPAIAR